MNKDTEQLAQALQQLFAEHDRRTPEQQEQEFEDFCLPARIETLIKGQEFFDPNGETTEEVANAALKTIARQLLSGTPSKEALLYVGLQLQNFIDGKCTSLDEAFFISAKRAAGGQPQDAKLIRNVCSAYLNAIVFHTHYDPNTTDASLKEIKKLAENAAFAAYRELKPKRKRKDTKEEDVTDDQATVMAQTIRPILREHLKEIAKM
jgi:hypothetical protein